ncbi:probable G-protein coupled receptor 34 isoform X1 [Alosa sapidissima]|uniref:probable G-protein coupled receptor 34 isoform X1 n=2 Tax=Alosa sapidissima TaxID=34773 RepID=UPI001C0A08BC|nr:probable G-protein coupled receptor 34 isoform X1 [Alosa sapidissima]
MERIHMVRLKTSHISFHTMDTTNSTGYPTPFTSNSSYALTSTTAMYRSQTMTAPGAPCNIDGGAMRIPLAIFYTLFFLFGLVGNLLALWVFLRVHDKKNSVRVFLINVALADLLLVICLPFRVMHHANGNHWILGPVMCRVVGHAFYMNMYISITLLGLISVDRYLKIHRSTSRKRFMRGRWSYVACGLLWSIAGVCAIILISVTTHKDEGKCFHYRQMSSKGLACFKYFLVALFWLVYASLVISYLKIGKMLQRASKDKPDLPNAHKYRQTARKSFFVLFLFTVCFVPYHIVRVFYIASQLSDTPCAWQDAADKANEAALLLSAFNSCLDPVMYFLLCSSIRRTTLEIFRKLIREPNVVVSSVSSSELGRSQRERPSLANINSVHAQSERMVIHTPVKGK